jgi:hypothetical protein
MRMIVSFISNAHEIPNEETALTAGKELADEIAARLSQASITVDHPIEDNSLGAWFLNVEVDGVPFRLCLNFDLLGEPPREHWVLGIAPQGFLRRLLPMKHTTRGCERLSSAIQHVLRDLECSDIQWWDHQPHRQATTT